MLKKVLENKKLVITVSAIVIVLIVIVALLARCGLDEPKNGDSNSGKEIEQEDPYDGDGLEIIEDDGKSENRVDTSDYWERTPKSDDADKKSDNKTTDNQTGTDKTEENESTESDSQDSESTEGVSSEDTPEEDITWGTIY